MGNCRPISTCCSRVGYAPPPRRRPAGTGSLWQKAHEALKSFAKNTDLKREVGQYPASLCMHLSENFTQCIQPIFHCYPVPKGGHDHAKEPEPPSHPGGNPLFFQFYGRRTDRRR